jgi:hypothetical protein
MNERDPIYLSRQGLRRYQDAMPESIKSALAQARYKAVHQASTRQHHRPLFRPQSSPQRWGLGLSVASVITVLISLQAVQVISKDIDIGRLAAIDQKMMTDRLPVQAYLDPGFLAFQEGNSELESSQEATTSDAQNVLPVVTRATHAMREFWSLESLFPGSITGQTPLWSKLTMAQRDALAPLESYWPEMENERRRKWLKIADRFHLMSDEEQALAQERMQEWVALPATDRRQARAVFDSLVQVMPEDVRVMKWNEYQKLSDQERSRLMEQAQQRLTEADAPVPIARAEPKPAPSGSSNPTSRPRSALAGQPEKPFAR